MKRRPQSAAAELHDECREQAGEKVDATDDQRGVNASQWKRYRAIAGEGEKAKGDGKKRGDDNVAADCQRGAPAGVGGDDGAKERQ